MAFSGVSPEVIQQIKAAARTNAPSRRSEELVQVDARHKGRARPPEPFSPVAERLILGRLAACRGLQEMVAATAAALGGACRELRRAEETMRKAGEVPSWAEAGVLGACSGVADAMAAAAAVLSSGDIAAELEELGREVERGCDGLEEGLVELDNQEIRCFNEIMDAVARKDQAAAELRRLCPEDSPEEERASAAVERAAKAQASVIEELAAKMDKAASIRMRKERRSAEFREALRRLDASCAEQAGDTTRTCARALEEAGQTMLGRAKAIHGREDGQAAAHQQRLAPQSGGIEMPSAVRSEARQSPEAAARHQAAEPQAAAAAARPAPAEQPQGKGKAKPKAEARAQPQAEPRAEAKAEAMAGPKAQPKAEARAETRAEPRPTLGLHGAIAEAVTATVSEEAAAARTSTPTQASASSSTPGGAARDQLLRTSAGDPVEVSPAAVSAEAESLLSVHFGTDVPRLGFEVIWETGQPSVGKVTEGSEAERSGILTGSVLVAIGDLETQGLPRERLMPLLKARPLELRLRRPQAEETPPMQHGMA